MNEVKLNFTYEELFLAVQESLILAQQKPDMRKAQAELNKAANDYLERLGLKPQFEVYDELEEK